VWSSDTSIWRYSRLNECPESLDHYSVTLAKAGIKASGAQLEKMAELARIEKLAKIEALPDRPISKLQPKDFELTIGGKTFKADSQLSMGALVYAGATTSDVMKYFKQLTESDSMPTVKSIPGKGDVYAAKITSGENAGSKITLRNFSDSAQQSGATWTIDVINPSINADKRIEIKFK
ncbi:hypothetical protein, partial [Pseudomonas viridiflava]|uniref:hypothetical protein n=1 Tax=Pseudomonas viridiflava TaxID=33069 RepID=UPI001A7E85CA